MTTRVVVYQLGDDGLTGPFLGYGSLVSWTLVLLHPPANRTVLTLGASRLRCQITDDHLGAQVIDGTLVVPDSALPGSPTSVNLDGQPSAAFTEVPGADDPKLTAAQVAQVVATFLETAARLDPEQPPLPAPQHADTGTHPPQFPFNHRPWYCVICPHAFGCGSG